MVQGAAIRDGGLRPRHLLTIAAISLVVIGCLAVLSAADGANTGSAFSYFAKAAGFGVAGLLGMAFLGRGGRKGNGGLVLAHRLTLVILGLGFAGVLFVMLPTGITPTINGAKRWIVLPGFTIQPSEILKPGLVLYLAMTLAREPWRARSLKDMAGPLGVVLVALAIVANEDLGSALVTGAVVITVLFVAGISGKQLGGLIGGAAAGAGALTLAAPERMERFTVFLHPFADRFDSGFQITNGLLAIGAGGVFGQGIGDGLQKHIIPEPQTDFILPVVMEEVGLAGATLIMVLYVAVVLLGLRIARGTKDPYERTVAAGLSAIVLWQAALNLWVVLGIAPLTGVPLPLISAGSTSQLILLAVIGILIDIDRRSQLPTVPLVTARDRPAAPVRPVAPTPPEPEGEELRVVDRRPAPAQPRAAAPAPQPRLTAPEGRRRVQPQQPARRPAAPPPAAPAGEPRVVQRVAGLEIRDDGTVKLPNGRVGRPRSPIALPDGRVLMPDGRILSRERATLAVRAGARPR